MIQRGKSGQRKQLDGLMMIMYIKGNKFMWVNSNFFTFLLVFFSQEKLPTAVKTPGDLQDA